MSLMYFITLFPLSTAVKTATNIPTSQGFDNSLFNLDFVSGFLLGISFVFILIGLSEKLDS